MLVVAMIGFALFAPGVLVAFGLAVSRWSRHARRVYPLTAVGSALLAVSVPFVSGDPVPLRVLQGFALAALAAVLVVAPGLLREYEEIADQAV